MNYKDIDEALEILEEAVINSKLLQQTDYNIKNIAKNIQNQKKTLNSNKLNYTSDNFPSVLSDVNNDTLTITTEQSSKSDTIGYVDSDLITVTHNQVPSDVFYSYEEPTKKYNHYNMAFQCINEKDNSDIDEIIDYL